MLSARHDGPENNFVTLPHDIFTRKDLSGNAVKLLGYLHVHGAIPNWQFSLRHMYEHVAGERALRTARNELIKAGYLTESRTKGKGQYERVDMTYYSYPIQTEMDSQKVDL